MIVHNNLTFQELVSPNNKDLNFKLNTKRQIGIWGQRYAKCLRDEHEERYFELLCSTELASQLEEMDAIYSKLFDEEFKKMKKKFKVTKSLKSKDYWEWKTRIKSAYDEAYEVVLKQIFESLSQEK